MALRRLFALLQNVSQPKCSEHKTGVPGSNAIALLRFRGREGPPEAERVPPSGCGGNIDRKAGNFTATEPTTHTGLYTLSSYPGNVFST